MMFSLPVVAKSHSVSPAYRQRILIKTDSKHAEDIVVQLHLALGH